MSDYVRGHWVPWGKNRNKSAEVKDRLEGGIMQVRLPRLKSVIFRYRVERTPLKSSSFETAK